MQLAVGGRGLSRRPPLQYRLVTPPACLACLLPGCPSFLSWAVSSPKLLFPLASTRRICFLVAGSCRGTAVRVRVSNVAPNLEITSARRSPARVAPARQRTPTLTSDSRNAVPARCMHTSRPAAADASDSLAAALVDDTGCPPRKWRSAPLMVASSHGQP
jgi:hypothetical protein